MPGKFLIAVNGTTVSAASKNNLTSFLQGKGWPTWHWFDDLWMVADVPDGVTVITLSAEIRNLPGFTGPAHYLVMSAGGHSPYNGWGPPEAWTWMTNFWGPPN